MPAPIFPQSGQPLSQVQMGIWLGQEIQPEAPLYHIGECFEVAASIDVARFERAVQEVITGTDALRLTLTQGTKGPWLKLAPRIDWQLTYLDLSSLADPVSAAQAWMSDFVDAPMDLGVCLFGFALIRLWDTYMWVQRFHHLAVDGLGSYQISWRIAERYNKHSSSPPKAWGSVAELLQWEQSYRESPQYEADLIYWKGLLAERGQAPTISGKRPAEPRESHTHFGYLARQTLQGLGRMRCWKTSPLMLALAALYVYRMTGRCRFFIGMAFARRPRRKHQRIVGMTAGVLPLRFDLNGKMTFTTLVDQAISQLELASKHQAVTLEDLAEEEGEPAFGLVVNVMPFTTEISLDGVAAKPRSVSRWATRDMELCVYERDTAGDLGIELHTHPQNYSRDTCALHHRQFMTLVERLSEAGSLSRLHQIPAMSPRERQLLLETWNQREDPGPVGTLKELFERQRQLHGSKRALVSGEEVLTYNELGQRVDSLAEQILVRGGGNLIGLYLNPGFEMVIAILAVFKVGAAYVPISPHYPRSRVDILLKDGNCSLVLTDKNLGKNLSGVDTLRVDKCYACQKVMMPRVSLLAPAYVIYTSGTTGQPNGVIQSHGNVSRLLAAAQREYQFGSSDVWTLFHAYTFDFSVWEMWGALAFGGTLVIPSEQTVRDPHAFATLLETQGVTLLNQTPRAFQGLAAAIMGRELELPKLRYVIFGGDRLDLAILSPWWKRFGDQQPQLINMYGITETCVHVTFKRVTQVDSTQVAHIGKPLMDMQTFILSADGELMPAGARGELAVGGAGLASGYMNRPGLTAQRFVPNPFGGAGERLYLSGDLARFLPDGQLEYLGRRDTQVKVRGYRIELGEIEAALNVLPEVKQAVVVTREMSAGPALVAYIVADRFDLPSLREDLAQRLPDYMVPAFIVKLEQIPLSINGKLDLSALPMPTADIADQVPPRNDLEASLCELWAEVLDLEQVGITDNYFHLGGDSLKAVRLNAACLTRLGVEIPLALLFEHKTIARLSPHLKTSEPVVIPSQNRETYPLSFTQEHLLFIERLEEGSSAYHVPLLVKVSSTADWEALLLAFADLASRHQIINTIYSSDRLGTDFQCVLSKAPTVSTHRVSDDELILSLRAQIEIAFDLSQEPSLRLHRFEAPSGEYLLMLWHHIAFDAWSQKVLVQDLARSYVARCKGEAPAFEPLEIGYGDYSLWQRQQLQGETLERLHSFWRDQLSGFETLHLYTDFPRPARLDYRGANSDFKLDGDLSERLRSLARERQTTLYTVMLSGFFALMARYSGQDDILLGTPSLNRKQAATQAMIGYFTNTLVIRSPLEMSDTCEVLIDRIHERVLSARDHDELAFGKLISCLGIEPDLGRHPLFQVMFLIQDEPLIHSHPELPFEEAELAPSEYFSPAKFDLCMSITEGSEIQGSLNYATSLSEDRTAAEMVTAYWLILQAFAEDPRQPIGTIEVVTPQNRQLQLVTWNQTEAPLPTTHTLHGLFETQVRRTPETTALIFADRAFTYAELNRMANQLAHGLGKHPLIALYLERDELMVVSILAVLKSGAAMVPISPEYPESRTRFILEDTGANLLITQEDHLGKFTCPSIAVDTYDFKSQPEAYQICGDGSDLAYILYTSGTTGKPKGVAMAHGIGTSRFFSTSCYGKLAGNRYLFKTNYVFDVAICDIFSHFFVGATLVMTRSSFDLDEIEDLIQRHRVNAAHFVPGQFSVLAMASDCYKTLERLYFSGEDLTVDQLKHIDFERTEVFNIYGPTETGETTYHLPQSVADAHIIGRPVPGARLYVLQQDTSLAPPGAPGMLHVGGSILAEGYFNGPELTAERFLENPFATEEDKAHGYKRMYNTGDLVRYLRDGRLQYLGRRDKQVKVRGHRIELAEIEYALNHLNTVKQAVVVPCERAGQVALAAFLVVDGAFNETVVRRQLVQQLPPYMIPESFTPIAALPFNVNGKLDRKALPQPEWHQEQSYTAPRNRFEMDLCEIWSQVLELDRVGVHDNFFRMGGNSISAVKLTAVSRQKLDLDIPLAALFAHKTVAALAAHLKSEQGEDIPALGRASYPLSYAQERLLFIERYEQGTAAYHIVHLVGLRPDTDAKALLWAFNRLADRHPVIKSVYTRDDQGHDVQKILPGDLCQHRHQVAQDQLPQVLEQLMREPFDLSEQPPLRLHHLITTERTYLLMLWHHIAFDAWSARIALSELERLYTARLENREPELLPLELTYGDYAHWQRSYLRDSVLADQQSYWQQRLAGFETLHLPTDFPRPEQFDYSGANFDFHLDVDLSQALRKLARERETTLYTVMLSAFYLTLAGYAGQDDLLLGTPSDNRHHPQTQSLIGFFTNTLALRISYDPDLDVTTWIEEVHRMVAVARVHQDLPFEKLVELTDVERERSRHPLFQVMFILLDITPEQVLERYPDLPFQGVDPELAERFQPAKFDLSLTMVDQPLIRGTLNYATSLFAPATIARIGNSYKRILKAMCAKPSARIGEIPMLSVTERHLQLVTWNNQEVTCFPEQTLHEGFEAQVRATPHQLALIFEQTELTYDALNQRANQLAHHLLDQYQVTNTRVGLYLDRGVDMVVAILAVLKAGATYVPVSPDYPSSRVDFILEDAQVSLLLTHHHYQKLFPKQTTTRVDRVLKDTPTNNPESTCTPENLAYILYTSGTTGAPNGVAMGHRASALRNHHMATLSETEANIYLFKTNYVFDVSVSDLFSHLYRGARLVMARSCFDLAEIEALVQRHHINAAHFVPSQFTAVAALGHLHGRFERIYFSGEDLTHEQLRHIDFARTQVFNYYGPTESGEATLHRVKGPEEQHIIGRPLPILQAYVVQRGRELAPIGACGELFLSGAGLALGYWNRPQLTRERFVDNPFVTEGQALMYATGDLVRYLPDGRLVYLGRNDDQVKIRGFRIEPAEVEAALGRLHGVAQVAVVPMSRGRGKTLVAYVVPERDAILEGEVLRGQIARKLPDYMVPAVIIPLDALPLTANGKLNRRALPKPEWTGQQAFQSPRNEREIQMCELWQETLGLARLGIRDNFFRLGGNSILAVKLIFQINRRFHINLSVASLFTNTSVASLCEHMRQLEQSQSLLKWFTPKHSGKPHLFMIHPGLGGAETYKDLAPQLEDLFECVGIDNYNLLFEERTDSLSRLARIYIEAIDKSLPLDDPIYLLGWSLGGAIALEMAYQLERLGKRRLEVFLLDTNYAGYLQRVQDKAVTAEVSEAMERLLTQKGFGQEYVARVISNLDNEQQLSLANLGGPLKYTRVVLLKAGKASILDASFDNELIQALVATPDNYMQRFCGKEIEVVLLQERDHLTVMEAYDALRTAVLGGAMSLRN